MIPVRNNADAEVIFNANINLAHWFAGKFNRVEEFDDLFQVACIGLFKACRTWNPDKSRLSSWATWHMRNEVWSHLYKVGRAHRAPKDANGSRGHMIVLPPISLEDTRELPGGKFTYYDRSNTFED